MRFFWSELWACRLWVLSSLVVFMDSGMFSIDPCFIVIWVDATSTECSCSDLGSVKVSISIELGTILIDFIRLIWCFTFNQFQFWLVWFWFFSSSNYLVWFWFGVGYLGFDAFSFTLAFGWLNLGLMSLTKFGPTESGSLARLIPCFLSSGYHFVCLSFIFRVWLGLSCISWCR